MSRYPDTFWCNLLYFIQVHIRLKNGCVLLFLLCTLYTMRTGSKSCVHMQYTFFPNPMVYLVHVWYDNRYWSKILCNTIPTQLHDRGSSIGSVFTLHASGPEFDPHVRHILSWRLGHENISTAILPLMQIQEEQLSVTGERMCTKYW